MAKKCLPNTLSVIRMVGVFPTAHFIMQGSYAAAFILFVILAATDLLDGCLARRWGTTTSLGKFLDPVADKTLILPTLFFLLIPGLFFDFLLLAFYEVMLFFTSIIAWLFPEQRWLNFGANKFGKVKMASEVTLVLLLFAGRMNVWSSEYVLRIFFFAAIVTAVLSLLGHWKFLGHKEQITAL